MHLDKAKQRYQELYQMRENRFSVRSCSEEGINELENRLGLKLPAAYKEFLLWTGGGGELFGGHQFSVSHVQFNREDAIEILEDNHASESLLKDAIVFFIRQGGYAFAFIQSSEGDTPPVHYFHPVRISKDLPLESKIIWNYSPNLEEFCLETINSFIRRLS